MLSLVMLSLLKFFEEQLRGRRFPLKKFGRLGPTTNFAGVFSSLLRKLVGTLDAVRQKKETS